MRSRSTGRRWGVVASAIAVLVAGVSLAAVSSAQSEPGAGAVVRTPDGALRGTVTKQNRSFEGVRYAAPAKRWVRAQEPKPWSGVRDATAPGSDCVQEAVFWRPESAASTNEDCLFLNVYTPAGDVRNRPVLVFFHGGGGINGAATDVAPTRMAAWGDNIVVSVNYRLGVFGGLELPGLDAETPDGASGGNYANTDKVQALRWLQDNIASFGGDPKRVTISGQSAGAGAVCWLLASPSAKGLFAAAAIESAGNCGGASSRQAAYASGESFAKAAGCADPPTMLACLRGLSAAEVLDVQAATGTGAGAVAGGSDLPVSPAQAFETGAFNRVPVIFGNTRNEARAFVYEGNDLVRQPVTATAFVAQINATYGAKAQAILAGYPLSDYPSPGIARAQVQTDDRVCNALPYARSMSKWAPTYTYEFRDETAPKRPYMTVPPSFPIGSGHTSEVPYLWQSEIIGELNGPQLDLSKLMIGYWSRFARTGDPNGGKTPNWPTFTAGSGEQRLGFLAAGRTETIGGAAFAAEHHCAVWDSLR